MLFLTTYSIPFFSSNVRLGLGCIEGWGKLFDSEQLQHIKLSFSLENKWSVLFGNTCFTHFKEVLFFRCRDDKASYIECVLLILCLNRVLVILRCPSWLKIKIAMKVGLFA